MVVSLSLRSPHFRPLKVGTAFPPFTLKVFDQDDLAGGSVGKLHFASRDALLDAELGQNKEIGVRVAFSLPAGLTPTRLEITEPGQRTFSVSLDGLK